MTNVFKDMLLLQVMMINNPSWLVLFLYVWTAVAVLHGFVFKYFFLLDSLPRKTRNMCLSYFLYLSCGDNKCKHGFCISTEWNVTDEASTLPERLSTTKDSWIMAEYTLSYQISCNDYQENKARHISIYRCWLNYFFFIISVFTYDVPMLSKKKREIKTWK